MRPLRFGLLLAPALLGLGCTPAKPDDDDLSALPTPPAGPSCSPQRLVLTLDEPSGADAGQGVEVDACQTLWVEGGSFGMGFNAKEVPYSVVLEAKDLDHLVRVSGFFLDRYEITLGRFATYALSYSGAPPSGTGAHPRIDGSGWRSEWDRLMPSDPAALLTEARISDDPSHLVDSKAPMGNLSWFVAFAFCAWDGGRLPTEAEWEFAAAGGEEDRYFPWGDEVDIADALRGGEPSVVGAHPELQGRFGQDDLAGGVHEWALDWLGEEFYAGQGKYCEDCANLVTSTGRVVRGAVDPSCCTGLNTEFRAAARAQEAPGSILPLQGARCAR